VSLQDDMDLFEEPRIRTPEEELDAIYESRVKTFVELGHAEKMAHYEQAWRVARAHLAKARERKAGHAP